MYAALVVSKPSTTEKMRHTVVANFGGNIVTFTRLTNGKQGRGNAWQLGAPLMSEIALDDLWCDPIVVQTTNRDALDLERGLPNTMLTKLVKRIPLERQSSIQVDDLFSEVYDLAVNDPAALAKYDTPVVIVRSPAAQSATATMGFVPSFEKVGHYIQRSWHGVEELAVYEFAHLNKMNILFEGPAGSGKTTSSEWYAMLNGLRYYPIQCNLELVASVLWGKVVQNKATGRWEWQDGAVTDVVRNGGVLVIDEITSADPRTMMNLNSLLDDRRMIVLPENNNEIVEAHPDLVIVAAHNPNYRGTRPMNEALRDRFDIKITFDYDVEIEKQFVKSGALLDLAKRMRKMSNPTFQSVASDDVAFETPISPRLLKAFEKIAKGLSYDLAVDIFVNNFNAEERSSVRMNMEALEYNIKSDLGLLEEAVTTEYQEA